MNKPPTLKNFFISGRGNHKSQNEMLLKLQEPYPSARKMLSYLPRYTPLIIIIVNSCFVWLSK